jgi:hypothetical protein
VSTECRAPGAETFRLVDQIAPEHLDHDSQSLMRSMQSIAQELPIS